MLARINWVWCSFCSHISLTFSRQHPEHFFHFLSILQPHRAITLSTCKCADNATWRSLNPITSALLLNVWFVNQRSVKHPLLIRDLLLLLDYWNWLERAHDRTISYQIKPLLVLRYEGLFTSGRLLSAYWLMRLLQVQVSSSMTASHCVHALAMRRLTITDVLIDFILAFWYYSEFQEMMEWVCDSRSGGEWNFDRRSRSNCSFNSFNFPRKLISGSLSLPLEYQANSFLGTSFRLTVARFLAAKDPFFKRCPFRVMHKIGVSYTRYGILRLIEANEALRRRYLLRNGSRFGAGSPNPQPWI
jgi:hypothetical protein